MPRGTYDEVHCAGGGSLLLWLLSCAGRAPRSARVIMHGPLVLPTVDSCAAWLKRELQDRDHPTLDDYEWRQQALALGAGGALRAAESRWLELLLRSIAAGRSNELAARYVAMQRRWERNNRIVYRPQLSDEPTPWDALCTAPGPDELKTARSPLLLRCNEIVCSEPEGCLLVESG